jgi:hypothetical protein
MLRADSTFVRAVEGCTALPRSTLAMGKPFITSDFGGSIDFKSLAAATTYLGSTAPAILDKRDQLRALASKSARVIFALPATTPAPAAAKAAAAPAAAKKP